MLLHRITALRSNDLWLVLALLTAGGGLIGCAGCSSSDPVAVDDESSSDGKTEPKKNNLPEGQPKPLLKGWDTPELALVLSGDQLGYIEPCGCDPETMAGGLSRRADLIRQIEERGWPVAALDLGNTVQRSRRQSKIKFDTILSAYRTLGYRVLVPSIQELQLGAEQLLAANVEEGDRPIPKFVAANVELFDDPTLMPERSHLFSAGGLKIGVTAVVGETDYQGDPLQGEFVTISPPAEALPPVIEEITAQSPDVMILLSSLSMDASRQLAEQFPAFDIILSSGPEEPRHEPEPVLETQVVSVGLKGKYVGVLGIYPEKAEPRFRWEVVHLDKERFQESGLMREEMRKYQERLKQERIAAEPAVSHVTGGQFVGAATCGECHTRAYRKWKSTRHAHAFESLSIGRKGQEENWISRAYDPECIACHVTGWAPQQVVRYESGFLPPEFVSDPEQKAHMELLKGQQCENCHGPGSEHTQIEEEWKANPKLVDRSRLDKHRRAMHISKADAEQTVCIRCHDLDNSPNFDFAKYWPEVEHPWRD